MIYFELISSYIQSEVKAVWRWHFEGFSTDVRGISKDASQKETVAGLPVAECENSIKLSEDAPVLKLTRQDKAPGVYGLSSDVWELVLNYLAMLQPLSLHFTILSDKRGILDRYLNDGTKQWLSPLQGKAIYTPLITIVGSRLSVHAAKYWQRTWPTAFLHMRRQQSVTKRTCGLPKTGGVCSSYNIIVWNFTAKKYDRVGDICCILGFRQYIWQNASSGPPREV